MMREFGDFDLNERLTDATRARICDSLHLGPQTTLALQLLADESAVLDPPAAELPTDAAPDAATAAHIFSSAVAYFTQTKPHLPDFLATRTWWEIPAVNSPSATTRRSWIRRRKAPALLLR
jgi:hypothetical protein